MRVGQVGSRILAAVVGTAAFVPQQARGQTTYFAVAAEGGGHMLRAAYTAGQLTSAYVTASVLKNYPDLPGISMRGYAVRVAIDSVSAEDERPGEEFHVRIQGSLPHDPTTAVCDSLAKLKRGMSPFQNRSPEFSSLEDRCLDAYNTYGEPGAVLLWQGPHAPTVLDVTTATLDSASEATVRRAADSLWLDALRDLEPDERQVTYRFGQREVYSVAGLPVIWVWIQAISSENDARGSFHFVMRKSPRSILVAGYGHPEWSPSSDIMAVRPYLFFRVGADRRTFLLAQRNTAWEDYSGGWAILDASTGKLIGGSN